MPIVKRNATSSEAVHITHRLRLMVFVVVACDLVACLRVHALAVFPVHAYVLLFKVNRIRFACCLQQHLVLHAPPILAYAAVKYLVLLLVCFRSRFVAHTSPAHVNASTYIVATCWTLYDVNTRRLWHVICAVFAGRCLVFRHKTAVYVTLCRSYCCDIGGTTVDG